MAGRELLFVTSNNIENASSHPLGQLLSYVKVPHCYSVCVVVMSSCGGVIVAGLVEAEWF